MSFDLNEAADRVNRNSGGKGPTLWVVHGMIFTEIEALHVLTGVETMHVAAGGVGGAEGAIWLSIFGTKEQLDKTEEAINSVRVEPAFIEN